MMINLHCIFLSFPISVSSLYSWTSGVYRFPWICFSVVARYTATCFPFLCILLQRGWINLSTKIWKRPFISIRATMNMVLPKARYCWQITVRTRRVRASRLQLLDVTTSTRDYTSATSATGRRATSRWYFRKRHFRFRWTTNASFPRRRTSAVSVEPRRTQERLHHQPGRELGLGECPPVRAFTLPTW